MPGFSDLSINKKLRYSMLAIAEVMLIITLIVYSINDYVESKRSMISRLESIVHVIGSVAGKHTAENNRQELNKIVSGLKLILAVREAHIINSDGQLVISHFQSNNDDSNRFDKKNNQKALTQNAWIDVVGPIFYQEKLVGSITIRGDLSLLNEKMLINLIAGVLIILVALLLSYMMANKLQKIIAMPIVRLAQAMNSLKGSKQYNIQLENGSSDEIGQLYDCFNEMILNIKKRDDKLSRHKEELEKTVELRTTALNIANENLKAAIYEANEAKEAALDAAKTKSTFLANMSHEIRTPMNGVLGMLELMKDTRLDNNQKDFLETAYGSADSLLQIINDILDFSKIEAGKMELENIDINPVTVVEDVASLLAEKAREKNLELSCYSDVTLPEYVKGDSVRLRQVLTNLLGNAIKFTEKGEVLLRIIDAGNSDTGQKILFEIKDTGIGIPEEALSKLFIPFTQADGSTTRKFGGTGLGLTISRQLVSIMGGELAVTSEAGKGSNFFFTVEFERSEFKPKDVSGQKASLSGKYALIVDDNDTNREILRHYLSSWKMKSIEAVDGDHAIEMIKKAIVQKSLFDIVYLDMQMPGKDGISVSKSMQKDSEMRDIPRIMLTSAGHMSEKEVKAAYLAGCLTKPYRQHQLHEMTQNVLYQNKPDDRVPVMNEKKQSLFSGQFKLLLVEDNLVNQKVALAMLKKIGLTADVAENGRIAVEMTEKHSYDLVLMDCQMPEMSGYEATGEVRKRESQNEQGVELPIVAMTANAMEGDREKCIAAGMNDYLTKPIKIEVLSNMLEKWLFSNQKDTIRVNLGSIDQGLVERLDNTLLLNDETLGQLREIMEDDFSLLVDSYLEDAPNLIKDIVRSAAEADEEVFVRATHTLKSSSLNLGAERLAELAKYMEEQGKLGQLQVLKPAIELLEETYHNTAADLGNVI